MKVGWLVHDAHRPWSSNKHFMQFMLRPFITVLRTSYSLKHRIITSLFQLKLRSCWGLRSNHLQISVTFKSVDIVQLLQFIQMNSEQCLVFPPPWGGQSVILSVWTTTLAVHISNCTHILLMMCSQRTETPADAAISYSPSRLLNPRLSS